MQLIPDMLHGLIDLDNNLVSLQIGPERSELVDTRVYDFLPENPTWDDTASLIACLDAVVTVDTAVSHLAGAMGKPVYLAMHQQGSWHYMADVPGSAWQTRSPWYPATRVYRQAKQDEWGDVVQRIADDLREV